MKILVIGANGTIGKVICKELEKRHEIVKSSRSGGDVMVDISSEASIKQMYNNVSGLDAIVCAAGEAKWGDFKSLSEEDYYVSIKSKLMGQINLVRIGQHKLNKGGSFTLTTGILAEDPVKGSAGPSMVNGGIHSFVLSAAQELDNDLRINVVAAGVVQDAYEKYESYFPGHLPVSMDRVAKAYSKSVEGQISGKIIRAY